MTALKKYLKLESNGLWRDAPEAQRREVLVSFGEATLVLSDPRSEDALSHWSLPAVERLNPGEMPALFAPGADADETLEIDDPVMIAALDTVRGALAAARPHPGRLRNSVLIGSTSLVLALALFWMPGKLVEQTALVVPPATRTEIGLMALDDLRRVTGAPCAGDLGQRALDALSERLFGSPKPLILVLRDGQSPALHLPGQIVLVNRALLEDHDGPEVLAGYALSEMARNAEEDPLLPLLRHAGLTATFRLLTTGVLSPDAVAGYAEVILRQTREPLDAGLLLPRFEAAGVPSTPYAFALDPSGESVLPLIEADPFRSGAPRPVMADGDWVSLQAICSE
ncbi:hypothetical protein RNZ50_04205 [Paracoccaceae bacterium Fryx2]|nr:hypothetical protein [Paracoccaceae bacterium Fryx2]